MEKVNHPKHYNSGKIEVIDFIDDQDLNFNLGNVVKYICRHRCKGQPKEDLQKALWYLMREMSKYDGGWNNNLYETLLQLVNENVKSNE